MMEKIIQTLSKTYFALDYFIYYIPNIPNIYLSYD